MLGAVGRWALGVCEGPLAINSYLEEERWTELYCAGVSRRKLACWGLYCYIVCNVGDIMTQYAYWVRAGDTK